MPFFVGNSLLRVRSNGPNVRSVGAIMPGKAKGIPLMTFLDTTVAAGDLYTDNSEYGADYAAHASQEAADGFSMAEAHHRAKVMRKARLASRAAARAMYRAVARASVHAA